MDPAEGIPRVELHCHLDSSMRIDTITELADQMGLSYDRPIEELARVPADCQSLIDFFVAIDIELDVLQHPAAIERAAAELAEVGMHRDGVVHGEVRFAPHLHQRNGHSVDKIIEAAHLGLRRAASNLGMILTELTRDGTTLECCPTSNVITRAVPSLAEHPIDLLHEEGVATTVSTDARTCLGIRLGEELELLTRTRMWDRDRHLEAQRAAAAAAFVPERRRRELLDAIAAA